MLEVDKNIETFANEFNPNYSMEVHIHTIREGGSVKRGAGTKGHCHSTHCEVVAIKRMKILKK